MPVPTIPTQVQTPTQTYAPPPYAPPGYPPQPAYPQPEYAPPGYPPYQQPYAYPMVQPPPTKTALPMAAGALLIVAGVLGLINWVLVALSAAGIIVGFGFLGDPIFGFLGTIFLICGIIGITFSVLALLGGIMALQRKMWGLGLTGSILGLFIFGFYGISSLLSLVALILLAVSHREFT